MGMGGGEGKRADHAAASIGGRDRAKFTPSSRVIGLIRRNWDREATATRHSRDTCATPVRQTHALWVTGTRQASARFAWRAVDGGKGEGIGHSVGVQGQRLVPCAVESGTGQPRAEPMRAGPRHARRPRGAGDIAGFEKRREEKTLPDRGPMGAIGLDGRGRGGGGDGASSDRIKQGKSYIGRGLVVVCGYRRCAGPLPALPLAAGGGVSRIW